MFLWRLDRPLLELRRPIRLQPAQQIPHVDLQAVLPRRQRLYRHGEELAAQRPGVLLLARGRQRRQGRPRLEQALDPDARILLRPPHAVLVEETTQATRIGP